MRIGRICRLRDSSHSKNPAMWFGLLAFASGFLVAPACAQGPRGAVAVAAGAAAAASAAAPAPKKTAASLALEAAAMGNSAAAKAMASDLAKAAPTEEANNGATPAGPAAPAAAAPAPPLTGVAGQCANLLKMATDLKSEVDKTTKDVLSVAVIRDAGQIEETAKKMRQQRH